MIGDIEALQSLQDDAARLDEFISKVERFNLFEAAGIVDWELSHSQILCFLLDPRGNHGMRDAFLRPLLDRILKSALHTGVTASSIDLRPRTLDGVIVLREHRDIDILVVDEEHGMAVIIENKIRSHEHSNQLARSSENGPRLV